MGSVEKPGLVERGQNMASSSTLFLLFLIIGQTLASEMCWESCFHVEDTDDERFREVYDDFYRMGMEARRLKNMYAVNGTALFLDSTLLLIMPPPSIWKIKPPNYGLLSVTWLQSQRS